MDSSDTMESSNATAERDSFTWKSCMTHSATTPFSSADNPQHKFYSSPYEESNIFVESTTAWNESYAPATESLGRSTISSLSPSTFLIGILGFIGICTVIFVTEASIFFYPIVLYYGFHLEPFLLWLPPSVFGVCLASWLYCLIEFLYHYKHGYDYRNALWKTLVNFERFLLAVGFVCWTGFTVMFVLDKMAERSEPRRWIEGS